MNISKITLWLASAVIAISVITMFIFWPIDMLILCGIIAFSASTLRILYYFLNERDYD